MYFNVETNKVDDSLKFIKTTHNQYNVFSILIYILYTSMNNLQKSVNKTYSNILFSILIYTTFIKAK